MSKKTYIIKDQGKGTLTGIDPERFIDIGSTGSGGSSGGDFIPLAGVNEETGPITGSLTATNTDFEFGAMVSPNGLNIISNYFEGIFRGQDANLTANRSYILPDKDGTVALLDDISGGGGDFIPLSGTEVGKPVTGDIEMSQGTKIFVPNGIDFKTNQVSLESDSVGLIAATVADGTSFIRAYNYGIEVFSDNPTSKGINSAQYFPNKDPNTFAQMQDLTDGYIPLSGTVVDKNMIGQFKMEEDEVTEFIQENSFDNSKYSFGVDGSEFKALARAEDVQRQSSIHIRPAATDIKYIDEPNTFEVTLSVNTTGVVVESLNDIKGISGSQDYSANYDDLTYVQKIYVDSIRPYKVYRALINQSGTSAPTAVVLENTLGFTPTYTRLDAGLYSITDVFDVSKTYLNMSSRFGDYRYAYAQIDGPEGGESGNIYIRTAQFVQGLEITPHLITAELPLSDISGNYYIPIEIIVYP